MILSPSARIIIPVALVLFYYNNNAMSRLTLSNTYYFVSLLTSISLPSIFYHTLHSAARTARDIYYKYVLIASSWGTDRIKIWLLSQFHTSLFAVLVWLLPKAGVTTIHTFKCI